MATAADRRGSGADSTRFPVRIPASGTHRRRPRGRAEWASNTADLFRTSKKSGTQASRPAFSVFYFIQNVIFYESFSFCSSVERPRAPHRGAVLPDCRPKTQRARGVRAARPDGGAAAAGPPQRAPYPAESPVPLVKMSPRGAGGSPRQRGGSSRVAAESPLSCRKPGAAGKNEPAGCGRLTQTAGRQRPGRRREPPIPQRARCRW